MAQELCGDTVHILLADDDSIDTEMVKRCLSKHKVSNPLVCVTDGVEALQILRGDNGHEKLPQPCIIILDINMPRKNGFQFMREMREDPHMRNNIVFMLTTSAGDSDRRLAYDLQAAGYFLKNQTSDFIQMLGEYCRINVFPRDGIPENYASSI